MKKVSQANPNILKYLGNTLISPFQKFPESDIDERLLRRIIGVLGMALPLVLMFWGFAILGGAHFQDSLSDYYSLRTRDAFVGILFVIGWFLLAYKGYSKMDSIAGNLACVFALGVALFPNSGSSWERIVHFTCATFMFLILAFFSLALFTKHGKPKENLSNTVMSAFHFDDSKLRLSSKSKKKQRNVIYRVCGILMIVCIILVALYNVFWQDTPLKNINPVFWLETIIIWSFGISWFTKGETWLKDN